MSDLFTLHCGDALDWLKSLPDDHVDLVFCSPPYTGARTYGVAAQRTTSDWVEWLRPIVTEACRVSRGLAFFNTSDQVEGCCYGNGPEWLHADVTRLDGLAACRPYVWVKTHPTNEEARIGGQPGSGSRHFHRNAWEPIYGYARPENLPPQWSDNTAFGLPPAHATGGAMTQRNADGSRTGAGRMATHGSAAQPAICNPGNVIRAMVGGGHLGHPLAHDSEAPMPLAVAERFVRWFCPPAGIVLDPFCGSSTTGHAAILHGRRFLGNDLRQSQVDLSRRRLEQVSGDGPGSLFAGQADAQRDFLENLP